MKKWKITAGILAGIILLAAVAVGVVVLLSGAAQQKHAEIYEIYAAMRSNIDQMTMTVLEDGEQIGVYDLRALGVREATASALEDRYTSYSKMRPEVFAQVPARQQLQWLFSEEPAREPLAVVTDGLELSAVLRDLRAVEREAPQDAFMEYTDGCFRVTKEVPGTVLEENKVKTLLTQTVKTMAAGGGSPAAVEVDLAEHGCYTQPKVTVANGNFDFDGCLNTALQDLTLTVDMHGEKEVLSNEQIREMVSVNEQGEVQVAEAMITELVTGWHEKYRKDATPYLFNAQIGGVKPMEFLTVDYEINQDETSAAVKEALLSLEQTETEAVWYCWRDGEAFAIEGEYVEVDIPNQKMTYVKDNEVLVCTDVVTGASWGYPTPPGYYKVENKDTNCWLKGEDYNVHVDYWIGFIGYVVGIHDADWRTKFGGTNYVKNGSHGCINTPKEATATIFENIDVGVPVLVYGK